MLRHFLLTTRYSLFTALLLLAPQAWGTIAAVGSLATANEKTSDADFAFTTSATLEAGNLAVCSFATDNVTTGGLTANHTGVTDSAGNTWQKACPECEVTSSSGGANEGSTLSAWRTIAATQLSSGQTITLNLSGSLTSKAVTCHEFTIGTTAALAWLYGYGFGSSSDCDVVGFGDTANSMTQSREYLKLRMDGIEIDSSTYSAAASWTAFTHTSSQTSGGTATDNIAARGSYHIQTTATPIDTTIRPTCSHSITDDARLHFEVHEYAGGWDAVRSLGSASKNAANTVVSITLPSHVGVVVGHVPIVIGAADNDGNGTDTDDYASPACSNSGTDATWTNVGQNEADPGAAAAGAAVVLCAVHGGVSTAIAAGGTITVTAATNRTTMAISVWDFYIPSGNQTLVVGTEQKEDSTSQAGSLTVSSIASGDLCIRGIAEETNSTSTDLTLTTGFTRFEEAGTTGAGAAANMTVLGEWIISTGTSCASDPATPNNGDQASSMIALRQQVPPASDAPVQTIMIGKNMQPVPWLDPNRNPSPERPAPRLPNGERRVALLLSNNAE